MRVSVFIATSLDGMIAGPQGELDWLDEANTLVPPGEDCGYGVFSETVDQIIMGRKTFEKVLSFGGEWPYGETPVTVLSSKAPPQQVYPSSVKWSQQSPETLINTCKAAGKRHVYIDGGQTIQSFAAVNLITDWTITTIPVILGEGISLWNLRSPQQRPLKLVRSQAYPFGFVQSVYDVLPSPPTET